MYNETKEGPLSDKVDLLRHDFTLGQGQLPQTWALPPNLWLQQQYAVVKPAKSYTGGVLWRVEVVDLVVLACVLRATTKKGRQLFCPPKYFPLEPPLDLLGLRGAVLHLSDKPGELSQWLCCEDSTMNIVLIVVVVARRVDCTIISYCTKCVCMCVNAPRTKVQ